ncbi:hypothetical protein LJB99_04840 [Deltaproteobacteria bacterium OttesenSCG-928-K17]|nr:hypothetical protein [Deltaproteobacteria bacterium OttesenSCG-928-K17]
MVIIFVLGILAMLAILGASIFLTTKTDYQVSSDTHTGREAFTNADLTLRTSVLLGRALIDPGAGTPSDALKNGGVSGGPVYSLVIHDFNLNKFQQLEDPLTGNPKVTDAMTKERYLLMTGAGGKTPPVRMYKDNILVGTAAISYGRGRITDPGGGAEGDYSGLTPFSIPAYLIVSVDGRVPQSSDTDSANYIEGDVSAKHTIITAIFRDILN